jgi:hypothetical protein
LNFQSNGVIEDLAVRFYDGVVLQTNIDNLCTFPQEICLVTSAPFRREVDALMKKFDLLDPRKSSTEEAPL